MMDAAVGRGSAARPALARTVFRGGRRTGQRVSITVTFTPAAASGPRTSSGGLPLAASTTSSSVLPRLRRRRDMLRTPDRRRAQARQGGDPGIRQHQAAALSACFTEQAAVARHAVTSLRCRFAGRADRAACGVESARPSPRRYPDVNRYPLPQARRFPPGPGHRRTRPERTHSRVATLPVMDETAGHSGRLLLVRCCR